MISSLKMSIKTFSFEEEKSVQNKFTPGLDSEFWSSEEVSKLCQKRWTFSIFKLFYLNIHTLDSFCQISIENSLPEETFSKNYPICLLPLESWLSRFSQNFWLCFTSQFKLIILRYHKLYFCLKHQSLNQQIFIRIRFLDSQSGWFCSPRRSIDSSRKPKDGCFFWRFSDLATHISPKLMSSLLNSRFQSTAICFRSSLRFKIDWCVRCISILIVRESPTAVKIDQFQCLDSTFFRFDFFH